MVNIGFVLGFALTQAPASRAAADFASGRIERRVVKSFDFDEARLGNYETSPMNWTRHTGRGFPQYLEARFDRSVGHAAPPAMVLSLLGGSLGAVYEGRDIPVHPRSEYRITAWIKPDRLVNARASLTAYYMDRALHKIEASERRCRPICGDDGWRQVVIDLPGGFSEARWIGLAAWVLQPNESGDVPLPIRRQDMHGGAWFDDISVLRLPRIALEPGQPGGLFAMNEPFELLARVNDPDGVGIQCELTVSDFVGEVQLRRSLPACIADEPMSHIDLSSLAPGWYRAIVSVTSSDGELIRRELPVVRLAPDIPVSDARGGGVGTLLDDWTQPSWTQTHRFLSALNASCVKFPFWSDRVTADDLINGNHAMDRVLHDLRADGTRVIAVLEAPPPPLASQYDPAHRSLLDVLSSDPQTWRPYLAVLIARYAGAVTQWQVGRDGDERVLGDPRATEAMARVRSEVAALAGTRGMAMPQSLVSSPGRERMAGAAVSLVVPASVPTDAIVDQLRPFVGATAAETWTTLAPIPSGRYDERIRLAELARRIVQARIGGAELIFVPQPWTVAGAGDAARLAPCAEFGIIRTLTQALSGTAKPEQLICDGGIHAWLFPRGEGHGTVVAWTDTNDTNGVLRLAVGPGARAYDPFGRPVEAVRATPTAAAHSADDHSIAFKVGYAPLIITPVEIGPARTQSAIRLSEPRIALLRTPQSNRIVISNHFSRALNARLTVRSPPAWHIVPTRFEVSLAADASGAYPVEIVLPTNESAGEARLLCDLEVPDRPDESVKAALPILVEAPGLRVDAWTQITGDHLTVYHRISNRGEQPLDLQTFVAAPGRARVTRLVRGLAPGATVEKDFDFDNARALQGHMIRVGIEQSDGPLRHNLVIPVG